MAINVTKKYNQENILGTVSQSAGVPTGAIIERGSNANGEYVKYADGTLIMTATVTIDAGTNALSSNVFSLPSSPVGDVAISVSAKSNSIDVLPAGSYESIVAANLKVTSGAATFPTSSFAVAPELEYTALRDSQIIVRVGVIGRWY